MSISAIFDLIFLLVLLIFTGMGVYRGFLKDFVRSTRWILSFLAANTFGGLLGGLLDSALIGPWVFDGIHGAVKDIFEKAGSEISSETLLSSFPGFIVNDHVREGVTAAFSGQSGDGLITSVSTLIASRISSVIASVLGFVLVFLLAFFLLKIVAGILTKWADRLLLVGALNRVLGGVWGFLLSSLLLLLVSFLIKLFFGDSEIYTDSVLVRAFADSAFFGFLNF